MVDFPWEKKHLQQTQVYTILIFQAKYEWGANQDQGWEVMTNHQAKLICWLIYRSSSFIQCKASFLLITFWKFNIV
jgi:hypothetical protein